MRADTVEPGLDLPAGDGVEGPVEPVAEIAIDEGAVALVGARRPVGIGRHVFLKGFAQDRHAARFGALVRRVVAARDFAQHLVRHATRLVGRYPVSGLLTRRF